MAAQRQTWFGGYEGVVAPLRGHTLDLHLLDDSREPFCGTELDLRPVTAGEANSDSVKWCLVCLEKAQEVRRDGAVSDGNPPPDYVVPQLTKFERDSRAALERRRDLLERRLADWDPRRDPDRTRGELAALRWVLQLIDACEESGLLVTLRERGHDL